MQQDETSKSKRVRLRAGAEPGVGSTRYRLLRSAAQRISQATSAGYWLEAVTLVESILAERLEKRAQYVHDHTGRVSAAALTNVKDGFANLGPLISALRKHETDKELHDMLEEVEQWRASRNIALHEMAKFGKGARQSWDERLQRAREIATDGIHVLLAYDEAERRVSHEGRRRTHASATCPNALEAIGQKVCKYCSPRNPGRTRSGQRGSSSARSWLRRT